MYSLHQTTLDTEHLAYIITFQYNSIMYGPVKKKKKSPPSLDFRSIITGIKPIFFRPVVNNVVQRKKNIKVEITI